MPKIVIPSMVIRKIQHWVSMGNNHECSGMGKTIIKDGVIRVVDVWMVKQKNSGAETEMDSEALSALMFEKRAVEGSWNYWWHSHANMGVFWSGTDRDQIGKMASNGMCVATVFNNKGETKSCIAISKPLPMHIDDVKLEIESELPKEIIDGWNKEYNDSVVKHTPFQYYGNSYSNWQPDYLSDRRWYPDYQMDMFEMDKKRAENPLSIPTPLKRNVSEAEINRDHRLADLAFEVNALESCVSGVTGGSISKLVADIIGYTWFPEMTLKTMTDQNQTIEDEIGDKLIELYEEEEVLNGANKGSALDKANGFNPLSSS